MRLLEIITEGSNIIDIFHDIYVNWTKKEAIEKLKDTI